MLWGDAVSTGDQETLELGLGLPNHGLLYGHGQEHRLQEDSFHDFLAPLFTTKTAGMEIPGMLMLRHITGMFHVLSSTSQPGHITNLKCLCLEFHSMPVDCP